MWAGDVGVYKCYLKIFMDELEQKGEFYQLKGQDPEGKPDYYLISNIPIILN